MVMRDTILFPAILAAALLAAACGSSEPEVVTGAAPADESPPTTTQEPVEGDPADGSPDDGGEASDSGDSGESGFDDSDDASYSGEDSGASSSSSSDESYGDEDSGASSSSSSDDADASYSGEDSGASSSSSSDDADASYGGAGEDLEPGSPDDTVSVTNDQIVGDGADISDPGPSNSGGPVPPEDRRQPARITNVDFQVLESWPMQVIVEVSGELPDPCHELWWEVAVDGNTYDVEVWSVSPPPDSDLVCAMMIQTFVENVPLGGGFVAEDYTVIVNGEAHELNF